VSVIASRPGLESPAGAGHRQRAPRRAVPDGTAGRACGARPPRSGRTPPVQVEMGASLR
jgi:hypothetical protein